MPDPSSSGIRQLPCTMAVGCCVSSLLCLSCLVPLLIQLQVFRETKDTVGAYGCDPSRHLQESPGPPGPKSQKNLKKRLLGGLLKSPRKYPKKKPKMPTFGPFLDIFRHFRVFFGTFLETPQKIDPFLRLFCNFGPGDSCKWRLGRLGRKRTVRSPSRSAFSKAPQKLLFVDLGRKGYAYQTSWSRFGGGSSSTPGALP